jgi:RimJ/RimL family protein N-acetyltransferase
MKLRNGETHELCRHSHALIETERLIIRPFRPDDWQDMYEYLSREDVVWYEPYLPFTEDDAKNEANRRAATGVLIDIPDGEPVEWHDFHAVCLKSSGKLIGGVYLSRHDYGNWELGYVMNPGYGRLGYATEAVRALVGYVFKELGAHRVYAECSTENERSWRLLERLGFRREGLLKKNVCFKEDETGAPLWWDSYIYAVLVEEWEEIIVLSLPSP